MASRTGEEKKRITCSFCGKGQEQVRRLIAGNGVYICDECVDLCSETVSYTHLESVSQSLSGNVGLLDEACDN